MRTETIEKTIYKYDELSDTAKANAREWFTSGDDFDFDKDYVYEDAARMGALMGIELDTKPVKLMGGGIRYEPCVYFSGFSSQGDGACFEGSYRYQKGGVKAIKGECNDAELIRIAKQLQAVQRQNFYRLRATTSHRGHYYHSGCMSVSVEDCENQYRDLRDAEDTITQLLRDFADWIYDQLEKAYDYRMSDEVAEEGILANEYEFDEHGHIH